MRSRNTHLQPRLLSQASGPKACLPSKPCQGTGKKKLPLLHLSAQIYAVQYGSIYMALNLLPPPVLKFEIYLIWIATCILAYEMQQCGTHSLALHHSGRPPLSTVPPQESFGPHGTAGCRSPAGSERVSRHEHAAQNPLAAAYKENSNRISKALSRAQCRVDSCLLTNFFFIFYPQTWLQGG